MKLISFAVCSYNSASFMRKCIDSLLPGGKDVEIIIIDDGSKDDTGKIADEYMKAYPDIVKAIHQPNGGHGEGLNTAAKAATGLYFKVVDSDDWVEQDTYKSILTFLKEGKDLPDVLINDYNYYFGYEKKVRHMSYHNCLPENETVLWNQVKSFNITEYMTIHSVMYKTEVWRMSKVILPKHTFYEDNLFVYSALPHVKSLRYMPESFYCYLIGRPGQSVSGDVTLRRAMDLVHVADTVFNMYDVMSYKKDNPKLYETLAHHLQMICAPVYLYGRINKNKDIRKAVKDFDRSWHEKNKKQYHRIMRRTSVFFLAIPGFLGTLNCRIAYFFSTHVFNYAK